MHPVNAMLNYAYVVLNARTKIRLIKDGYDLSIGILHDRVHDRETYPAFAFDHTEKKRLAVDRSILELVESTTITGSDISIQHDGVCGLNPELARRAARMAMQYTSSIDRELPGPQL